jgi:hypothetical protein
LLWSAEMGDNGLVVGLSKVVDRGKVSGDPVSYFPVVNVFPYCDNFSSHVGAWYSVVGNPSDVISEL